MRILVNKSKYSIIKYLGLTIAIILFACSKSVLPPYKYSQTKNHNEANLYYETYGNGSPIIFIHGFGGRIYTWRYLIDPLSKCYQLYLIDLKGFGFSPKPHDDNYSAITQATLIYDFIVKQRLAKVVIVGHSFGGLVAILTALKIQEAEPGNISALILIDSVSYRQPLPLYIRLLRTPIISSIITSIFTKEYQVKRILKLAYYNEKNITEEVIREYAEPLYMPNGRYALIQTAREIIPKDPESIIRQYKNIAIPTLLIWGQHDKIVPLYLGEQLNKSIPKSELVAINYCGHNPQEEQPARTTNIIKDFLRKRQDYND